MTSDRTVELSSFKGNLNEFTETEASKLRTTQLVGQLNNRGDVYLAPKSNTLLQHFLLFSYIKPENQYPMHLVCWCSFIFRKK